MPTVSDKGSWKQQFNSKFADLVANIFGQRVNFTLRYYSHRHRLPNFKHPKDLSERILSSMLSKDFLKYADYADKVKVREYVKAKGLEHILLEQYGIWEDTNQIDFDKLPDKFILKANNGCGGHVICTDKSQLDIPATINHMNATMNGAEHLRNTEPHYCAIKPMILAEQLLGDGKKLPEDYKIYCIRGKVCLIYVVSDRESDRKCAAMDVDWNFLPYLLDEYLPKQLPAKPKHLDEMVEVAQKLSSDFEFVRVDLYESQDKVYFGELTFSPFGGMLNSFKTEAIDLLGKKFDE